MNVGRLLDFSFMCWLPKRLWDEGRAAIYHAAARQGEG